MHLLFEEGIRRRVMKITIYLICTMLLLSAVLHPIPVPSKAVQSESEGRFGGQKQGNDYVTEGEMFWKYILPVVLSIWVLLEYY